MEGRCEHPQCHRCTRFPAAPLITRLALVEPSLSAVAHILHTNRGVVRRWLHKGIPYYRADALACAIGCHPQQIWPDWYDHDPCPTCLTRAATTRKHAAA